MAISNQQIIIGGYIYNVKATLVDHDGTSKDVTVNNFVKEQIQKLAQALEAQSTNPQKPLSSYKVIHINNDGFKLGDEQQMQFATIPQIKKAWDDAVGAIQSSHTVDTTQRDHRPLEATRATVEFTVGDRVAADSELSATPTDHSYLSTPPGLNQLVKDYKLPADSTTASEAIEHCWEYASIQNLDEDSKVKLFMLVANKYANQIDDAKKLAIRAAVLKKLHDLLGEIVKAEESKESYWTRAYRWFTSSTSNLRDENSTIMAEKIASLELDQLYNASNPKPDAGTIKAGPPKGH